MQVKIQEVTVESVTKGRNKYQVANVVYTFNGENRTQKLLSFANPESFKVVSGITTPTDVEVTITKNDAGYNQWAKVEILTDVPKTAPVASAPAAGGKVLGSQYETREERLERQLHIVRQSCLGYAISSLTPGAKAALNPETVIQIAEEFVDFVYGNNEEILAAPNSNLQDVAF